MKNLHNRMRKALVTAPCLGLLVHPAFAGSSKSKSSTRNLCEYCAWLPGIDSYGEESEYECDGTHAKGTLKLNTKKCTLELCFKGKVYNYSCDSYCAYVDPCDYIEEVISDSCCGEYGYDCWEILELLDCCKYEVAAVKKSKKTNYCVNATLLCTGYLGDSAS